MFFCDELRDKLVVFVLSIFTLDGLSLGRDLVDVLMFLELLVGLFFCGDLETAVDFLGELVFFWFTTFF